MEPGYGKATKSIPIQVKKWAQANIKGRGNLYFVISVSEMKPEPTLPKKLNIETHETKILIDLDVYPSDSPIWPMLSMAAIDEPHPKSVPTRISPMSLLNRACKMVKSSPRSGLLNTFERQVGEFVSGISSIGVKDSLFLGVELDEDFISGMKTGGDGLLSVCPLSLKSMSSSLTAINRGIESNPTITAAPLVYPAEENAACFCVMVRNKRNKARMIETYSKW